MSRETVPSTPSGNRATLVAGGGVHLALSLALAIVEQVQGQPDWVKFVENALTCLSPQILKFLRDDKLAASTDAGTLGPKPAAPSRTIAMVTPPPHVHSRFTTAYLLRRLASLSGYAAAARSAVTRV
mgnify:CR=1 FL=1